MWEGWCQLRKTQKARCHNGSSASVGSGKRRGGRRPRGGVPGRSYHCSFPRPPSWHPRMSGSRFLLFFSFVIFLGALHIFSGQQTGNLDKMYAAIELCACHLLTLPRLHTLSMVARLPTSPLVLVARLPAALTSLVLVLALLRFATWSHPGHACYKYGAIVTARCRYEMTRCIVGKGSACYVW